MSSVRVAHALDEIDVRKAEAARDFGGRPPASRPAPMVSNGRLALVLFMMTETMLFAGLMGTFVVFRVSSRQWPPVGQPYLPVAVTWVNTAILLASAWTMHAAVRAVRQAALARLRSELLVTLALGATFLGVQGFEWTRLIAHGLTLSSSNYGATFYTLIGLHALHVVGAVGWLAAVAVGAGGGRYTALRHVGVELCSMYWYYVCGLWVILFTLVYLK